MTEQIRWDEEILNTKLNDFKESCNKYHNINSIVYEVPEGMEAIKNFRSFQEALHKVLAVYIQVIECDIGQIETIMHMILELDNGILQVKN